MNRRDFLATSFAASMAVSVHEWLNVQPGRAYSPYSYFRAYDPWTSDNLFLQGINAPVFQEVDIDRLEVTGHIPADLEGIYLRNGPNPMFQPFIYQFPLDGDGMLHAVYFEQSTARYRNRWIKTQGLTYEMVAGRSLRELRFRNYANTSIVAHAGVLLALYETGLPYQVTSDLETVGEWNFQGGIQQSMSAHPRYDPETGELHFHRYSLFNQPYLTYFVANAQGEVIHQLPVELPQPTLLHDLALTSHYAIMFDCPLVFDWQQAMQRGSPFIWQPDRPTRIGLLPRPGRAAHLKQPLWIETDPFWIWHFVNAYETDQNLVIDCIAYPEMRLDNAVDTVLSYESHLHQIVIDLATRTVTQQPLDDRIVELPTLDARKIGQPYQFTYTIHANPDWATQQRLPNYFPALIQYDRVNQRSAVHRFPPGCYAGEAIVVPKAGSTSEQDCYVMTWVFNEQRQTSDLVILDADQFDRDPIAQIHLPVRVPFGAHGTWVPLSAAG
jgi:carotenoid cleavage dioxygenase-like enzyme